MSKFLIIPAFKESAIIPFANVKGVLGSVGLVALCYAIVYFMMSSLFNFSLDPVTGIKFDELASAENVSGLAVFLVFLFVFGGVLVVTGALFNYWVRFAVYGSNGAINPDRGELIKSAIINALKMAGIGLLIALVLLISMGALALIFGVLGMIDTDALARGEQSPFLVVMNIISITIACFIYSDMSKSLTRTAIGRSYEPPVDADRTDFAVVLMLIYLPLILLTPIATALFGLVTSMILQMIVSVWVYFAIAAAHGVRHRLCSVEEV